jgi:Glycine-zipper domain
MRMRKRWIVAVLVGIVAELAAAGAGAEVFVYPKKGQSQQQFEQDQFQCHGWAKQQTGVDPAQTQVATTPTPEQGGAVRGAARGAAVGAIGGAIGGDAGKGAAIGAGVGGAGGAMKQGARNREAAATAQQAQAQQQTNLQRYEKAYGTCMEGRGYQVR